MDQLRRQLCHAVDSGRLSLEEASKQLADQHAIMVKQPDENALAKLNQAYAN